MSRPPSAPAVSFPVAELERRFYALVLDRLLGWGLCAGLATLAWWLLGRESSWRLVTVLAGMLVVVLVATAVAVGVAGVSPGKALVGLRVVHVGTGTPIGFGRALLRGLVLALATLPTAGIGLATLAWTAVEDRTRRRRGWHDHLARSVVVDVRPVPEAVTEVVDGPRHVVNLTALRLVPAPAAEAAPDDDGGPVPTAASARTRGVQPGPPPVESRPGPPGPWPSAPMPSGSVPSAPAHRGPSPVVPPSDPSGPRQFGWGHAGPPGTSPGPGPGAEPGQPPAPRPGTPSPDHEEGRTVVRARSAAPARWRVTFDTGDTFVVEGLVLVGRRPEPRPGEPVRHVVPLPSADMSVSKTHAQVTISPEDGALVVTDRGSTNGSHLVRKGVARGLPPGKPTTLLPGDKVGFGDREMTVAREA